MRNNNIPKNCLIICSADHKIGSGHLIRSQILAESLKKKRWKIFLFGPNKNQKNTIKKKIFSKIILLSKTGKKNFFQEINKKVNTVIQNNRINLIFIDSYIISNRLQKKWNKLFIFKINNTNKNNLNCDLVLNYSFQADQKKINSKFLLGPRYSLIQNKFKKPKKINSKKILITFGGSNTLTQIQKTLKCIDLELPNYKIHISTPSEFFYKILLEKIPKKISVILSLNLSKIINKYKYEFIISSGGHTLYEIVANKYPALFLSIFKNQNKNIDYLKENDLAKAFRYKAKKYEKELTGFLKSYKKNKKIFQIKQKIAKIINRKGQEKVARIINTMFLKNYHKNFGILETKRLKLIPLTEKNYKKLFYLRDKISNEKEVFREKNKITINEHIEWYKNYSEQNRIDYLIFEKNIKKYIGCLHYKISKNEAEMGKFISEKSFLGKGYGFEAAKKWIEFGIKDNGFSKIIAITSKKNVININLNKKLGFKRINNKNSLWQKMIYR